MGEAEEAVPAPGADQKPGPAISGAAAATAAIATTTGNGNCSTVRNGFRALALHNWTIFESNEIELIKGQHVTDIQQLTKYW